MHALQVAGAQFADVRESLIFGTPDARNLIAREVCFGSRLCENADAESFCATIESGAWLRRIIVAAKAKFTTQYFVSVSK